MGTVRYTTVDGEVIAEKRGGVRSLYVPDPLGSTVALLDNTQAQTDTFEYWPYGEVRTRTGSTPTPFQYLGMIGYYQDNANRNYVRARHLGNDKGRWLNKDPIGFNSGDVNLYRYANCNPATYVDSSGLNPPKPGIGNRECPGADAVDLIRKLLHTRPNCLKDFQKLCNGQSLGTVLSQIKFVIRKPCNPTDPTVPCLVDAPGVIAGKQCVPKDICFSSFECSRSKKHRANDLLFEIGNWCNCKYHKLAGGEAPTVHMCLDCGFPKRWCLPGGVK